MDDPRTLQLLERHLDLLPPSKQPLARWLCEDGALSATRLPGKLRQRFMAVLPSGAQGPNAPKLLLRELVLELLSQHRREIAKRERGGGNQHRPLAPVLVRLRRS
jgi:hypothetical protein